MTRHTLPSITLVLTSVLFFVTPPALAVAMNLKAVNVPLLSWLTILVLIGCGAFLRGVLGLLCGWCFCLVGPIYYAIVCSDFSTIERENAVVHFDLIPLLLLVVGTICWLLYIQVFMLLRASRRRRVRTRRWLLPVLLRTVVFSLISCSFTCGWPGFQPPLIALCLVLVLGTCLVGIYAARCRRGVLMAVSLLLFCAPTSGDDDRRLFGSDEEGLLQLTLLIKERYPDKLLPPDLAFYPATAEHDSGRLAIVCGSAATDCSEDLTEFTKRGGRVLVMAANYELYRGVGGEWRRRDGAWLGYDAQRVLRIVVVDDLWDNQYLSRGGRSVLRYLELLEEQEVEGVRLLNRSHYLLHPNKEYRPAWAKSAYEESLENPRFTDGNKSLRRYRYAPGQADRYFNEFSFEPYIRQNVVRYRVFDGFEEDDRGGHFRIVGDTREPMSPSGASGALVGECFFKSEYGPGEEVYVPSLAPGAQLVSFEVCSLEAVGSVQANLIRGGFSWPRVFGDGEKEDPPPSPPPAPAPEPTGVSKVPAKLGQATSWSHLCQWSRDGAGNWYLRVQPPERTRFGLRYSIDANTSEYCATWGYTSRSRDDWQEQLQGLGVTDGLTVRDWHEQLAMRGVSMPRDLSDDRVTQIGRLLAEHSVFGSEDDLGALSAVDALHALSSLFGQFRDRGIANIYEYDSFMEAALMHRAGVCRHRARIGFLMLTYLEIPTRLVINTVHALLEVPLPIENGTVWIQVDLGGGNGPSGDPARQIPVPEEGPEEPPPPPEGGGDLSWIVELAKQTLLPGICIVMVLVIVAAASTKFARIRRQLRAEADRPHLDHGLRRDLQGGDYTSIVVADASHLITDACLRMGVPSGTSSIRDALSDGHELVQSNESGWLSLLAQYESLIAERRRVSWRTARKMCRLIKRLRESLDHGV